MNKKITVLGGLLMAVVMTAYSVSGTYAKYTSTFTGSDSARVAKWAFKIGDNTDMTQNTFTFDLFSTINDTVLDNDGNIVAETDVAAPNSTDTTNNISGLIAPGTRGSFKLALRNLSEVNAKYSLELTETNAGNVPIEYSLDGTNWITATDVGGGVRTIAFTGITNQALNMNATSDTEMTIQWRWAFEGADSTNYQTTQTDVTDTTLGIGGTATVTVDAKVIVTQVD